VKILLDTHLLLWAVGFPELLPAPAFKLMRAPENDLYFSVSSIWEVAIKHGLGRADFKAPPGLLRRTLLDDGYEELPILGQHAVALSSLPPIHKDPFDRILIAQAMVEGITLLTADRVISQYPGPIQRV
jgi:PIN domain nuclease of toxin-antitoxin system